MSTLTASPVIERSTLLDGIRGFALMGIVGANFGVLSMWIFMSPEMQAALPGARFDPIIGFLHSVFIEGKFYSIFSLLFGIGFGIFLEKGTSAMKRYMRRMLILAVIGALHLRLIWEGDILLLYALLGLLLPLFRKLRDRTLLVFACVLILMPVALDAITVYTDGAFYPARSLTAHAKARAVEEGFTPDTPFTVLSDGGLSEFRRYQSIGWLWRIQHLVASNRLPKVLGIFLIGLWVARRGIHCDPSAHIPLLRKVAWFGVLVALPISIFRWWSGERLSHLPDVQTLINSITYALSVIPMALAYSAAIALLWRRAFVSRVLKVLAPAGRMALTNYLIQSVAGQLLFTGMGLGLGARVTPVIFESLALGVFAVQLIYSHIWMKHFNYGPMEWIWRVLTYGRRMPMHSMVARISI